MSTLYTAVYKCLEYGTYDTQESAWNIDGTQEVLVEKMNRGLYGYFVPKEA